jgi:hypothetical protein
MKEYLNVLSYLGLFVFFMLSDLALYYGIGSRHASVPFYIFSALTLIVAVVAGMALFEIHKHRNDKEPW